MLFKQNDMYDFIFIAYISFGNNFGKFRAETISLRNVYILILKIQDGRTSPSNTVCFVSKNNTVNLSCCCKRTIHNAWVGVNIKKNTV